MNSRPGRHVAGDTVGGDGSAQLKQAANAFIASQIQQLTMNDEKIFRSLDHLFINAEDRIAKLELDGRQSYLASAGQLSTAGRIERPTSDEMRTHHQLSRSKLARDKSFKSGVKPQKLAHAGQTFYSSWDDEGQINDDLCRMSRELTQVGADGGAMARPATLIESSSSFPTLRGQSFNMTALAACNHMGCSRCLPDIQQSMIDSGANINIVGSRVQLDNTRNPQYQVSDMTGHQTQPSEAGEHKLFVFTSTGHKTYITIDNAHRVDGAPNNLISISSLTKHGYRFEFDRFEGRMYTSPNCRIDFIERDGLYWLPWRTVAQELALPVNRGGFTGAAIESERLSVEVANWETIHKLLGHINMQKVRAMVRNGDAGFTSRQAFRECICLFCQLNKMTRQPPAPMRGNPRLHRVFEIVSADLKGPFELDIFGNRYWIVFVCYRSSWAMVYAMKRKSESMKYTKKFLKDIQLMNKDFRVERFHTDGGGEFTSDAYMSWLRDRLMRQTLTSAYSAFQNGKVERMNRKLIEGTRTLLAAAGLSAKYWSLAVKHCAYLLNRVYSRNLAEGTQQNSPYRIVFGRAPDLSNLHIWGAKAIMHVHGTTSLEPTGRELIFVGLAEDRKAKVGLDPVTNKLYSTTHMRILPDVPIMGAAENPAPKPEANFELEKQEAEILDRELTANDRVDDGDSFETHDVTAQAEEGALPSVQGQPAVQSTEFTPEETRRSKRIRESSKSVEPKAGSTSQPDISPPVDERLSRLSGDEQLQCPMIPIRSSKVGDQEELTSATKSLIKLALDFELEINFKASNPKMPETLSRARYEKYKQSKTIRGMLQRGGTMADFRNDFSHGYVTIVQPTQNEWNQLLKRKLNRMEAKGTHLAQYIEQGYLENASICQDISPELFRFACVAATLLDEDPQSVEEAKARPDWPEWERAMHEEFHGNLIARGCLQEMTPEMFSEKAESDWTYVSPKWVFRRKYNPDGTLQRYKARLVAKGYKQEWGKDFDMTFAPVFAYSTMRTALAIACETDMRIDSFDVANAFIQCDLDRDNLLMRCPPGINIIGPDGRKMVYRLNKALYGLKQSARMLSETLYDLLTSFGFSQLSSDQSAFIKGSGADAQLLLVWVDDMLLFTPRENDSMRAEFQHHMSAALEMSTYTGGETKQALGINITRTAETLKIDVNQAIEKLAKKFGLDDALSERTTIPMHPDAKLTKPDDSEIIPESKFEYMSAVGSLLYITMTARPDIAQVTGQLSRFMAYPSALCVAVAKQAIRYLYKTRFDGIIYRRTGSSRLANATKAPANDLTVYVDASWANDSDTQRSISGYVFVLFGGAIDWSSRLQSMVASSTAESEVIAACEAVKRVMFTRVLLRELQFKQFYPITVMEDNTATIAFVDLYVNVRKVRHYLTRVRFLQEQAMFGTFTFEKVATAAQLADIMTKPLDRQAFNRCREGFGMDSTTTVNRSRTSPSNGGEITLDAQAAAAGVSHESRCQASTREPIEQSHDDANQTFYNESSCYVDSDEQPYHADFQQTYTCILSRSNTRC